MLLLYFRIIFHISLDNSIEDVVVDEDSAPVNIDLSNVFYDVENESNLSLFVSETMDQLNAEIDDETLVLTFIENGFGSGEVTVSASDNVSRLTVSTTFSVSITSVNDAPVIDPLVDQVIDEDTSLTLTLSASDIDGDELTFSAENEKPVFVSPFTGI